MIGNLIQCGELVVIIFLKGIIAAFYVISNYRRRASYGGRRNMAHL